MRWMAMIFAAALAWWSVPASAAETDGAPVDGYLLLDANGVVHGLGDATSFAPGQPVRGAGDRAASLAARPDGEGYTVAFADGSIGAGGAAYRPDLLGRLRPGERVAATRLTPVAFGSWTVTTSGRVIAESLATHHGDLDGVPLQGEITDLVPTVSGNGYWLVAADGGVFAFGDATFHGSMGGRPLNAPVIDLVPDGDGVGYWLIASDGGVFAFDAPFRGSLPGILAGRALNAPVTAAVSAPGGYVLVGGDGGVFDFADEAPFLGSLADDPPDAPIVDLVPVYDIDRWILDATAIDEGEGPQLCWGTLDSYPPQCGGGVGAVGLDWDWIDDVETAAGTTWGEGRVIVTAVDATTPVTTAVRVLGPAPDPGPFVPRYVDGLEPMCDPPAGGWTHPDPARVTDERFRAALAAAEALPTHANSAVGRIVELGDFPDDPAEQEEWMERGSDPFNFIVTLRVTADAEASVRAAQEHWGGPICVLPARFTETEQRAAAKALPVDDPNLLGAGFGSWFDGVELNLLVADGALAERFDREVGAGMTSTTAWFQPLG